MNKKLTTSLVASLLLATNLTANETLDTITVTSATKSEQSIKDVTSNVEVITSQDIQERHFTNVSDALKTLTGVDITTNGGLGSSSSLYLRGMDTSRTLVLVDGVRFQDPSNTSGANLSHLMIDNIEKIEIIKGAQSGIWGADAAAGVINIITKKASKGTNVSVNVEAGSFNTKKYGTSISHSEGSYDIKFTANKIKSDGYSGVVSYGKNPKDFEKDGYENTTLTLDTNYYINDNTKIGFNVKDIDALAEYDKDSSSPNDTTMKSDSDTRLYSVSLNHKVSVHDIKFKYDLSKFNRHEIGTVGSSWGESVLKFNGESHNIELSDKIDYASESFFIFGLGASKDDVDYLLTDNSTNQQESKNQNLSITNSNKFERLVLTQSLRYDKYKNHDNQVTGKIGLKYFVNDELSLSSNLGKAYNPPSIVKELYPWSSTGANPDLEPEEIKSVDFELSYNEFSATYFRYKIDNLIDWSGGGYKNVKGESRIDGYEFKYQKHFMENFLLNLNYTHIDARNSKDEFLGRRAKRQLGFAVDYYGFAKTHINVNGSYVGTRYDENNKEGRQTGRYTLWNTVVNYEVNKNLSTYLKVDNITDKYYQTVDGYATAGRSAYVGLNYKF